ncbi:MAG: MMPL family transporter [Pseudomonadales bacterium]
MSQTSSSAPLQTSSWLERWVAGVVAHANAVLSALLLLTLAAFWIAIERFSINADLGDLIDQSAPWRQDYDRYEAAFPERVNTLVLLVSGESYFDVEQATRRLQARLRDDPEHFRSVYAPAVDPFFREHALLYLDAEALDDLIDRLAEAQPLLSALAADPSLRGLFERLISALSQTESASADHALGTDRIFKLLETSADAMLDGADPTIIWTDELFSQSADVVRVLSAKGALRTDELGVESEISKAEVMAAVRALLADTQLPSSVQVQLTGEIALAHEEIAAATSGVARAGWLSVVLLLGVLIIGVRSIKIIGGTFALLIAGVIWTSAYAMLAVGQYNTLSIVFLVMFFGLGVDFAVHFSLRYQEAINHRLRSAAVGSAASKVSSETISVALQTTVRSVGNPICLCALSTAIAFLGFWPTSYQGLADLGVISAGGMLIAGFLTFTLLPAYYRVVGRIRHHETELTSGQRLVAALTKQRRYVLVALVCGVVIAGFSAAHSYFDYSVLALRDDQSESMQSLRRLQDEGLVTDYSLSVLTAEPFAPNDLETMPEVDSVVAAADYLPAEQPQKLETLADAQDLFWDLFATDGVGAPASARSIRRSLQNLVSALEDSKDARYQGLIRDLTDVSAGNEQTLFIWQRAVLSNLQEELVWLRGALQVDAVTFDDLPLALQRLLRSSDGEYLLQINPAEDLSDTSALSRFVDLVRQRMPSATGRPVIEWGVGQIVVESFYTATIIAGAGVLLILLLRYRRPMDAVLILVPLAVAMLFTLALGVWFDRPLNMANILVLPLIFGLGVDNGIHVVDRFHGSDDVNRLIHSSTPRAVLLSTLTTIGAFASLMLSPHQGTASIGLLLTFAVSMVLLLTVVVLPVLLSYFSREVLPINSNRADGRA